MSGRYGKGPAVFWGNASGSINSQSYCEHILLVLKNYFFARADL
jgi:hypothetical protein